MIGKLQELLNFTNAEGEIITLFDGKITLSQLVVIVLGVLIIGVIIKTIKGIFRLIGTGIAIAYICIHFGIASPDDFSNVAQQIKQNGIESYMQFAETSDKIKIDGNSILIKVDDEWVNVSDITSAINCEDGKTIVINGESYIIEDSTVLDLLNNLQ